MSLYARYVGWVYLKTFLIVFGALELFYVGIDLLTNLKELPASANLQLFYSGLTALLAVNYVMPISLVLALIIAHVNMVRSNELVSFYALGISKNALIMPPFLIASAATLLYVGLNFTPFAYASEFQKSVATGASFNKSANDGFLKFEGKFIYVKELKPLEKKASDVRIFDINGTDLASATFAKSANFEDNRWELREVSQTTLPKNLELGAVGLTTRNFDELDALSGFTPKSIASASDQSANFSILDALDFIWTFKNEGALLANARSILYSLAAAPFFAPFLALILYYYLPVTGRFFNLAFASFVFVAVTLVVWGVLFVLGKFSQNSFIAPEIGILSPVVVLGAYAFWLVKSHR